ncbi:hypothetical protein AB1K32_03950 [Metabacillus dongyingensis]|uniref:hypothetical protein n=1 Tax=Metabacillus dongyingensis TaxID=2874282 RepID=UPI003B8CB2D2
MSNNDEEKSKDQPPKWLLPILPFISLALGGASLWFSWFRYTRMVNQFGFQWYNWIQPVLLVLAGILFFYAALLFIIGKPSGWAILINGISVIPVILFINLVILIGRGIVHLIKGAEMPSISALYSSSIDKSLLTAAVIIIVISIVKGLINKKV